MAAKTWDEIYGEGAGKDGKDGTCPSCHANRLTSAEVMRLATLPAEELERALMRSYAYPNLTIVGMSHAEIKAYGKKLSYEALIEILVDKKQPGATRKACAELLIERDEGKSPAVINQNVNVTNTQILGLDRVQLLRIMEQAVERQRRMLGNTTSSVALPNVALTES